ncbi:MAG: P27 family phage terminase small subunit [Gemmatimonadota bacterium]
MPRRRKSEADKALEGTDRPDRARDEAAFPAVESIDGVERPDWLIDPVAKAKWDELVKQLSDAGVLTTADLDELAHYCNLHARHVNLWRANMAPTASETTQRRLLATEFGLTPASRSKPAKTGKSEKTASRFGELRAS